MIKIEHVVSSIRNASNGASQCIPPMLNSQSKLGLNVTLHTLDMFGIDNDMNFIVKTYKRDWILGNKVGRSRSMRNALRKSTADIIHDHGTWEMPNIYAGQGCQNKTCKLICTPHGNFTKYAWNYSKWKKKAFSPIILILISGVLGILLYGV